MALIVAIIRATWIVFRALVDFLTGSGVPVGGWFWAFIISLLRPGYSGVNYGRILTFGKKLEAPASESNEGEPTRSVPPTPSQQSVDTTHTASDSPPSRHSNTDMVGNCCANGLLLRKVTDQSPTSTVWQNTNVQWCRIGCTDGRTADKGKTNRFDGCDWLKLCADHADKYDEWTLPQQCAARECWHTRSGTAINGATSTYCLRHIPNRR